MIEYHSQIGIAAWTDLLRLLKDETTSDLRGRPRLKRVGRKDYWYDHFRLGRRKIDRYIGEDSPELRERLARQTGTVEKVKHKRTHRARLMRTLRAEGYLMSDVGSGQLIAALAKAGVFRLGGTLIGTLAFRCYEGELGVHIGCDQAAMSDDVDIASFEGLSLALQDQVDERLVEVLSQLEFELASSLGQGRGWRWRQSERQTLVEFLTPSFDEA